MGFPRLFASDRRIFRLFSCTALMSRPCLLMLMITFVGRISDCIRTQNSSKTTLCGVISSLHNTWASHKTSRMEAGKSWRLTKISSRARKISEHFSSTLSRECLAREELFWLEKNTKCEVFIVDKLDWWAHDNKHWGKRERDKYRLYLQNDFVNTNEEDDMIIDLSLISKFASQ